MQLELFGEQAIPDAFPPRTVGSSLVGLIFHASWGYNATNNTFAVVVHETEKTVVLAKLRNQRVSGDDTAGMERPVLPTSDGPAWRSSADFRLRKKQGSDGGLFLQQDFKIFQPWDGKDRHYNSD